GETAEMPGMYAPEEYDLAGFAVGIVEKQQLVTGASIDAGYDLIGLPSSGIHSNGYSLVRKVLFEQAGLTGDEVFAELGDEKLGDVLLEPTKIYVDSLKPILQQQLAAGLSHITGGGFIENIPRMLPSGLGAEIQVGSWDVLPIFELIASLGKIPQHELYEIFNMGIGMVIAAAPENTPLILALLAEQGEAARVIGQVVALDTAEQPLVRMVEEAL
ncbi:MAG TPA: phosphoribosylformylglycinamidine cyclo-ligase, partial [Enterococcus sp.]|nr:phosphoribosylformylglycinamidine cyclo-ligase [Enterococcus sp.]